MKLIFPRFSFVLLALLSCQSNSININKDIYSKSIHTNPSTITSCAASDSIVLILNPEIIKQLNWDVPFRVFREKVFFLLKTNELVSVNIKEPKAIKVKSLNQFKFRINDYTVINQDSILIVNNEKGLFLYDFKNTSVNQVMKHEKLVYNASPFVGVNIVVLDDYYITPHVREKDYTESNFASLWNKNLTYEHSFGYFDVNDVPCKSAYFYTPMISNVCNKMIAIGTSSSKNVSFYNLSQKGSFDYLETAALPDLPKQPECIPDTLMDNLKFQNKLYVTSSFYASLFLTKEKLFRIAKREQTFINNKTNLVNTFLDSKWLLISYDIKKRQSNIRNFEENQYQYMSAVLIGDMVYVPKVFSNKIVLYGFD